MREGASAANGEERDACASQEVQVSERPRRLHDVQPAFRSRRLTKRPHAANADFIQESLIEEHSRIQPIVIREDRNVATRDGAGAADCIDHCHRRFDFLEGNRSRRATRVEDQRPRLDGRVSPGRLQELQRLIDRQDAVTRAISWRRRLSRSNAIGTTKSFTGSEFEQLPWRQALDTIFVTAFVPAENPISSYS